METSTKQSEEIYPYLVTLDVSRYSTDGEDGKDASLIMAVDINDAISHAIAVYNGSFDTDLGFDNVLSAVRLSGDFVFFTEQARKWYKEHYGNPNDET